jgi:hypothetical protein
MKHGNLSLLVLIQERFMNALTDAVGLRPFRARAGVVDVLNRQIQLIRMPIRRAAISMPRSVRIRQSLTACSAKNGSSGWASAD